MTTPTNKNVSVDLQALAATARKNIAQVFEARGLRQFAADISGKTGKTLAQSSVTGIAPALMGYVFALVNERPSVVRVKLEVNLDLPERYENETDQSYMARLKLAVLDGVTEQAKQFGKDAPLGKSADYDRLRGEAAGVNVKISLTERVPGAKPVNSTAFVGAESAGKAVNQLLKDDRERFSPKVIKSDTPLPVKADLTRTLAAALANPNEDHGAEETPGVPSASTVGPTPAEEAAAAEVAAD